MDIAQRSRGSWTNEDQRWIGGGGRQGMPNRSIILDRALFPNSGRYAGGVIPSGEPLGRVTATGRYGPYGASPSEVQTVNLGAATAGTVTITFDGATTGAIAFNATAATVQAALEALPNVGPGDVVVTGGPLPGTITLTFGGRYLGQNVPQVVVTPTGLTGGTVTVATTTEGGGAVVDGREKLAGHLFASVPIDRDSTGNPGGALFWDGEVITNYLPAPVDAAGQADVAGHISYVTHVI